jgi:hypothetical protein
MKINSRVFYTFALTIILLSSKLLADAPSAKTHRLVFDMLIVQISESLSSFRAAKLERDRKNNAEYLNNLIFRAWLISRGPDAIKGTNSTEQVLLDSLMRKAFKEITNIDFEQRDPLFCIYKFKTPEVIESFRQMVANSPNIF